MCILVTMTQTMSLFRNGSLIPARYTGEVAEVTDKADASRPVGHAPRHGSLYATVDLFSVGRWVSGNWSVHRHNNDVDKTTREIRVNTAGLYVYSVRAWENVSWHGKDASVYWNTAIPLSEWARVSAERGLVADEWEVLVPTEAVVSSKVCSNRRVITAQPKNSYQRHNLMFTLEPRKASRSIQW